MSADGSSEAPASSELTFSFGGYGAEHPSLPTTAGFGIRTAARLIDIGVHWLIALVSGFVFGLFLLIAAGGNQIAVQNAVASLRQRSIIALVLSILGSAMYHTVCEGGYGSTLGKLIMGLVVLGEDGQPCRFRSALGRSFAFYIDSLFFGIIGYMAMKGSPLDQRKGDEWFHTIVAKRKATPAVAVRGLGRFVAVAIVAAVVDAVFVLLGFLAHIQNWG
ncbi:MAG: RDD family protein [Acidobacteriia bacterium]|nr:RDD family protein [Terriglobia bacterium]